MIENSLQDINILVVDDAPRNALILQTILEDIGYSVKSVNNGLQALEAVEESPPDIILLDVTMPEMDGFETCKHLKRKPTTQDIPVIFVTSRSETESIVKGFEVGAVDYITPPYNVKELQARIKTHIKLKRTEKALRERIEGLQRTRQMIRIAAGIEDIVALSPAMKAVMEKAVLFHYSSNFSVVIEGETGSGKEVLAKIIHYGDGCTDTPFVDINIAAIPPNLFESELFGYNAGAFTGASKTGQIGKLEISGNGTLLLDEIGELSLRLQPKLLRIIEERTFYRIGGKKKRRFRARVIATTNRNLQQMVEQGQFRPDLYHRLNVGYLYVPPLRDRKEEILPLARMFLKRCADRQGTEPRKLSPEACEYLLNYNWPGNVRELINTIESACVLCRENEISLNLVLPQRIPYRNALTVNENRKSTADHPISDFKKVSLPENELDLEALNDWIILKALHKFEGNKTRASRYLKVSRYALYRRLEKINK